ncbi:hypothetical protein GIB67_013507 [Kingdonia uniflora]|uniref:Uncharacterized protein n=1 Tax=Kingdonia uniflora TaxID=39325 RepID=A0A7J7KUS8_9MAGN|nr:hypothetical protein GIB67_013507 [Kingdonia uniflora]
MIWHTTIIKSANLKDDLQKETIDCAITVSSFQTFSHFRSTMWRKMWLIISRRSLIRNMDRLGIAISVNPLPQFLNTVVFLLVKAFCLSGMNLTIYLKRKQDLRIHLHWIDS